MIAVYIVAVILVLVALILLIKVKVRARVQSSAEILLYAGPVKIRLLGKGKEPGDNFQRLKELEKEKKKKAKKKSKKDKKEKKDKDREEKKEKEMSLTEKIRYYSALITRALESARGFSKKISVSIRKINIIVSTDDPMKTTMEYEALNKSLSVLFTLLEEKTRFHLNMDEAKLGVDYLRGSSSIEGDVTVGIRVISALILLLKILIVKNKLDNEFGKSEEQNG